MTKLWKTTARTYATVALLGWQDSLVYRFNALVWVLYAVVPSITAMMVWIATYDSKTPTSSTRAGETVQIGGLSLGEMMTYYLLITALSVVITPHPEWEIAQAIRDGKITQFIVRPIGYFGYRAAQETSYQIVKSAMLLPVLAIATWFFRDTLQLFTPTWSQFALFLLAAILAYAMLVQIKFLLGISAFWISEPGGFMEIWNILTGVLGGRLLPLVLLPLWLQNLSAVLPFASMYDFPIRLLQGKATSQQIASGFLIQIAWLLTLAVVVRVGWKRGLLAYEGYGG